MSGDKLRIGFVGLGWIGLERFKSLMESDLIEPVGWVEPDDSACSLAQALAPRAKAYRDVMELAGQQLDGIVIATPSALHARQCLVALEQGISVFCQKPLACNVRETQAVLNAAARADRLLKVDLCYRETQALRRVREIVRSGAIGRVFAAELVFHNAYGPNKSWAFEPEMAGGGCVIDLGVHLVDAALWILDAEYSASSMQCYRGGRLLPGGSARIEEFAIGSLSLSSGVAASLVCSWHSSIGEHARIRVELFGDHGGVAFENVAGSFYDFRATLQRGASRELLIEPPDPWSGRAIVNWASELRESRRYRPTGDLLNLARAIDGLYDRSREHAELGEADWVP